MSPLTTFRFRNGATARNRLAVAPMTTTQSHPDGRVSDTEAAWLARLANDGYGLVITCAAAISREAIAFPNQLNLGDDAFIDALRPVAQCFRDRGTLGIVQLCHGGARALPHLTGHEARSASAFSLPGLPTPRPFTTAELESIVDDHVHAAMRAVDAGFHGVELHGANGYLFTQFLNPATNQRNDAYGGSLEGRARLARDVVRAVRARVPQDFLLGFRLSFEGAGPLTGLDIDENIAVMNVLAEDGLDYGHISSRDFAATSLRYTSNIALMHIRAGVDRALPLMCAGSVWDRHDAERALDAGADLVAIGRAAIGNDRIPERFAAGEAVARTPYSREQLERVAVSADFMRYLTAPGPVASMKIMG